MIFSQVFCLAIASTVAALDLPAPTQAPEKRDMKDCYKVLSEQSDALIAAPTVDLAMIEFLGQQTQLATVTDNCLIPSVTGSLAPQYTSWQKSVTKWQIEHSTALQQLQSACSDMMENIVSGLGLPVEGGMVGTATVCSHYYFETQSAKSPAAKRRTEEAALAAVIATSLLVVCLL